MLTMEIIRYSIGISIAFIAGSAAAHEGTDPLTAWYRSLTTADGKSCCSMHDCAPAEARMKEGRWEVLIFPYNADAPRWFPVPDRAVLRRSPGYRPALAAESGSRSSGCRSRRPAGASGVVRLPPPGYGTPSRRPATGCCRRNGRSACALALRSSRPSPLNRHSPDSRRLRGQDRPFDRLGQSKR